MKIKKGDDVIVIAGKDKGANRQGHLRGPASVSAWSSRVSTW